MNPYHDYDPYDNEPNCLWCQTNECDYFPDQCAEEECELFVQSVEEAENDYF